MTKSFTTVSLTGLVGRGQKLSPRPRRARSLGGGARNEHKLWQAIFDGRWRKIVEWRASWMEALWRRDLERSATNPYAVLSRLTISSCAVDCWWSNFRCSFLIVGWSHCSCCFFRNRWRDRRLVGRWPFWRWLLGLAFWVAFGSSWFHCPFVLLTRRWISERPPCCFLRFPVGVWPRGG